MSKYNTNEYLEFDENSGVDYKKIALYIMIPVLAIAFIVGTIYFGVIPLGIKEPTQIEEPTFIEVITTPLEEKIVEENPIFVETNIDGLLPTTPQNFDNTPKVNSLEPITPQPNRPVQTGNLDDIDSKYRRFLESGFSIEEILYIQNTPCPELSSDDTEKYHDILGVKGC